MKRLAAILLSALFLISLASCRNTADETPDNNKGDNTTLPGVNAPVDILNTVWNSYGDDEKFFATGGDMSDPVDNAPGAMDIADADSMLSLAVCPADALAMIDGSASLIHAMNANNFTGVAYHLKNTADKDDFTAAMKEAITNNQWLCGFPEKLVIATLADDYVVVAFGSTEIVDNFKGKLTAAYDVTQIETDETLS